MMLLLSAPCTAAVLLLLLGGVDVLVLYQCTNMFSSVRTVNYEYQCDRYIYGHTGTYERTGTRSYT